MLLCWFLVSRHGPQPTATARGAFSIRSTHFSFVVVLIGTKFTALGYEGNEVTFHSAFSFVRRMLLAVTLLLNHARHKNSLLVDMKIVY
jgi:hypothetical protein